MSSLLGINHQTKHSLASCLCIFPLSDFTIHLSRLQKDMGETTNTSLDTVVTDFILLGLPHPPSLRTLLFLVVFIIYVLTQLGNLLILVIVSVDPQLHAQWTRSSMPVPCTSFLVFSPSLTWASLPSLSLPSLSLTS